MPNKISGCVIANSKGYHLIALDSACINAFFIRDDLKHNFEILNLEEQLTLGQLMDRDIKKFALEIDEISSTATNETSLERMLDKLTKIWKKLEFEVLPYKDKKNVYIIGSVDDIITQLDDSLVTISTLLGSRFVKPIKTQVEDWQGKLSKFQDTLDAWMQSSETRSIILSQQAGFMGISWYQAEDGKIWWTQIFAK